jgi:tetratricopeptide (TPR) repeat protein
MAKPMLVTLPCVLLLLDYWPLRRMARPDSMRWLIREKVPMLALAGLAAAVTVWAQRAGSAIGSFKRFPFGVRLENAFVSYVAYLGKILWPTGLAPFYSHPGSSISASTVAGCIAVLTVVTLICWVLRRDRPYLLVGWLWYAITLLPVIGLVQVGLQGMADRYAYIPLVGILMLPIWGTFDWLGRSRLAETTIVLAGGLILAACTAATWRQEQYWKNSTTLWTHALESGQDNVVVRNNLGRALESAGQSDLALIQYQAAVNVAPDNPEAHYNLGGSFARRGMRREAVTELSEAVRLRPTFARAHHNLGLALAELGAWNEAVSHYEQALEIEPAYALAHNSLGRALLHLGRYPEAAARFAEAVHILPEFSLARDNLGVALCMQGKWQDAVSCFGEAIAREPGVGQYHWDRAHALHETGDIQPAEQAYQQALHLDPSLPYRTSQEAWRLATARQNLDRNGTMALRLAKQACEATHYQGPRFLDSLAAAYAEVGSFADAARTGRRATDQTPPGDLAETRIRENRVRQYENKMPWRESPGDH